MSSDEGYEHIYTDQSKEHRVLEPVADVTREFLDHVETEYKDSFIAQDISIPDIYRSYWNSRPAQHTNQNSIAINPNIFGTPSSFKPSNPMHEGFLAGPPSNNNVGWRDTRAYLFKTDTGYRIVKGIGRRYLAREEGDVSREFGKYSGRNYQYSRTHGWGSIGGVLENNIIPEIGSGYETAELYRRVFHTWPSMRLVHTVTDITEALKSEGAKVKENHFQAHYEIDTPVRTNYSKYIYNLGEFWYGIDLQDSAGKLEALAMLNDMLMAYPKRYFPDGNFKPLELSDLNTILDLLEDHRKLLAGDDAEVETKKVKTGFLKHETDQGTANFTASEKEQQGLIRYQIAMAGKELATVFYERNKVAVERTISEEVTEFGKFVGFATGLGIELYSAIMPKDTYGKVIADLDVLNQEAVYDRTPNADIKTGVTNVVSLCDMYGLTDQITAFYIQRYLASVSQGFKQTIEHIDDCYLVPEYLTALKSYFQELVTKNISDPNSGPEHILLYQLLEQNIEALEGIGISDTFGDVQPSFGQVNTRHTDHLIIAGEMDVRGTDNKVHRIKEKLPDQLEQSTLIRAFKIGMVKGTFRCIPNKK